jgi:hypothetical protein
LLRLLSFWILVPAAGDDDDDDDDDRCRAFGGMIGRSKPALVSLYPLQIPYELSRTRNRAAEVGSLSYDTALQYIKVSILPEVEAKAHSL